MESRLFPMSTLVGLGRGCRLRLSEAWWGLVMLNRIDSLTHRDCGNQDVVTIAELCLNQIESCTTELSGYKYSTIAMDCYSGVWAFLLHAFALTYRVPFLGYNPDYNSIWTPQYMDTAVQRLVRTPTGDWKLMVAPAVCEYVLASSNVRVKDTMWKIVKMRAAPLQSMMVTGMPLELSDVEVKEGLVAGVKRVLPREAARDLARLEACRLFVRPWERPGGPKTRETKELAWGATASVDSATQPDARPTRSVRVFTPPALIDRFVQNRHVSIWWSVHSFRQYTPTQYYCKMCQRMGSHSSKYHRGGTAQKGPKIIHE